MRRHRLILISDIHYTVGETPRDKEGFLYHYEEGIDFRMQKMMSLIHEEYKKAPIDAVIFLGDTTHDKEHNFREFCRTWLPKLPCPAHLLPGNHESYSEEVWKEMTGSGRQSVVNLPYCHILMCDCFSDLKHPHQLQPIDMEFLSEQALRYQGEKLLICTHYFQWEKALEQWLLSTPQVVAVFHGHTHSALPVMEEIGGKKVISTGNFSYGLNMKPESNWYQKFGWSITEVTEDNGQWQCRKIFPDMEYRFSQLHAGNRFYQEMNCDYTVKKEYGEWILL